MENPKLTNLHINTYALSNSLNTMAFTVTVLFGNLFMTDYLGISNLAVGTGMLIAKIVDFLLGLIAGIVIEKVNMKRGKYLSWIRLLTVTLFFGNIIQMLDTTSFISSSTTRLIIVMIAYMIFHGSMNFYTTSRAALIPKMAGADMNLRKKLTTRQAQVAAATAIISSAVTLPAVNLVQELTNSASLGYTIVAAVFSLLFFIVNLIFTKLAAPFDPPAEEAVQRQTVTVSQMIMSVVSNKQMLVLFSGFTFFTIGSQIYANITSYYFRVTGTLGNPMTYALTARSVCALAASMVSPFISRRLGKKNSLALGWIIYAAGTLSIWAFAINSDGSPNLVAMTVAMCLCQSAMSLYSIFMANYYLDCGEYGYNVSGIDNRTMAVTVMNWPTKIGFALGGSLGLYFMDWAGYKPSLVEGLPSSVDNMNRFLVSIGLIPALVMIVGTVIIMLGYKLTDKQAAEYAKANAEREAASQAGN